MLRAREDDAFPPSKRARLDEDVSYLEETLPEMRHVIYERLDVVALLRLRQVCRRVHGETHLFLPASWLPAVWQPFWAKLRGGEKAQAAWHCFLQLVASHPLFPGLTRGVHTYITPTDVEMQWVRASSCNTYAVVLTATWDMGQREWFARLEIVDAAGWSYEYGTPKFIGTFHRIQWIHKHPVYHEGGWTVADPLDWNVAILRAVARRPLLLVRPQIRAATIAETIFS
jgi:hypothetical protein